jgi:hypothetical protein
MKRGLKIELPYKVFHTMSESRNSGEDFIGFQKL